MAINDGNVFLLFTPKHNNHFNKMFLKETPKWKKFSLPFVNNGYADKTYFDQMKKEMGEFMFKQEIEGVVF